MLLTQYRDLGARGELCPDSAQENAVNRQIKYEIDITYQIRNTL